MVVYWRGERQMVSEVGGWQLDSPPTQAHAKIWSRMRAADSSVNSSFHIRPFAYSLGAFKFWDNISYE